MMTSAVVVSPSQNSIGASVWSFLSFLLTEIFQLLLRNFTDCYVFMRDCWNDQPETETNFNSNVKHSRVLLREHSIHQVIQELDSHLAEEKEEEEENLLPMSVQPYRELTDLTPSMKPMLSYKLVSLENFSEPLI